MVSGGGRLLCGYGLQNATTARRQHSIVLLYTCTCTLISSRVLQNSYAGATKFFPRHCGLQNATTDILCVPSRTLQIAYAGVQPGYNSISRYFCPRFCAHSRWDFTNSLIYNICVCVCSVLIHSRALIQALQIHHLWSGLRLRPKKTLEI